MNHNTSFTFNGSLQYPDLWSSQGAQQAGGSLKRKSSHEDISPLVMKTRTGIGLEEEIVYDRTMTLMIEGQKRLLEEERQRQYHEQMQHQSQQQAYSQQQPQQSVSLQQQPKESPAEAMRRLFMFGKSQQPLAPHPGTVQHHQQTIHMSFADCAGEINGCETNRIPGMRDRHQAVIGPCTFCQRPQCQFCAVHCTACQEFFCRSCCVPSYDKSEVEYHCPGCRN
ncbi:hypothetical protein EDD21DRAFT_370631 [Dissophora ornata]|nr:hypothetical protein EDD21DRAFT_370631 [Dissophora ornata]